MKKVYVVCAAGVATSTMVRMKVEDFLRERGIDAHVTQYRVSELSVDRVDADAIVSTTGMPDEFAEVVPVLNGVALLTGIGQQAVLEELAEVLARS
ncbi:MAG: PTS sugar transporter subunit IIB [Actinobacteria bacterium]|nr:PTS sugar transporter subunit IIB [Actinomycetota bacterium]